MNLKLNRKFKDTLFRKVFNNKRDLLSLYNALNNTEHTDESLITINTIEDAIYIGYKNDISFIINSELNLYEHQSSVNPNMPVRGLIYFAELYKGYIDQNNLLIYNERLVKLPFPRYVVFYNGTEDEPEEQELRLSDSFVQVPEGEAQRTDIVEAEANKPSVEVTVQLLNINYGCNQELLEKCQKLMEYSRFIALVRVKSDMLTEEYKKEMIKLDASLENEREQLINQSNERKIIVIKAGSSIYFKDGEYKLFSQKEAISPAYIDEKLALPIECAEAAGLTVTNSEGNAASISYNGKKASVNLMTDGEVKYIPVREVFEALEFNVIWNDNGSVVIYDRSLNFDKSVIDKYANKLY